MSCCKMLVAFIAITALGCRFVGNEISPAQPQTDEVFDPWNSEIAIPGSTEPPAEAEQEGKVFIGKLVSIIDGDTIVVLDKEKVVIDLWGIDAPELGQPHGKEARQHLSKLLHGENVDPNVGITVIPTGRTGMVVAVVTTDAVVANLAMIRDGYAWHRAERPRNAVWFAGLARTEKQARKGKRGLWAGENPVPPGDWQMIHRNDERNREDAKPEQSERIGLNNE